MKDYSKTKIYYIQVGDERYYGHTVRPRLCDRAGQHRADFKNCPERKVYKHMREVGMTEKDIKLILVEHWPCKSKDEAEAREAYWIRKAGTLNRNVPQRKPNEWYNDNCEYMKQKAKEYRKANKQAISNRRKQLRRIQVNRLKMSQYKKEWYNKNKSKFLEKAKDYRDENRSEINEKRRQKYMCETCNCELTVGCKSRHERTKKHQDNLVKSA